MDKHLLRLAEIFRAIDLTYDAALDRYKFSCEGCQDNCCRTKFHHHALVEELYLAEGLKKLDPGVRERVMARAEEVVRVHNSSPDNVREMCPLNENGLCILYEHRPMICRIHGVPYELQKRDMSVEYGSGCYRFMAEKANADMKYLMFNRTIFYLEISKVEKEVREALNFTGEYSKTTAEMVLSILN